MGERKVSTPELVVSEAEEAKEDYVSVSGSEGTDSDANLEVYGSTPVQTNRMKRREKISRPSGSTSGENTRKKNRLEPKNVAFGDDYLSSDHDTPAEKRKVKKDRKIERDQKRKEKRTGGGRLVDSIHNVRQQLRAVSAFPDVFKSLPTLSGQETFDEPETSSGRATPKKILSPDASKSNLHDERAEYYRNFRREIRLEEKEQKRNEHMEGITIRARAGKGYVRMGTNDILFCDVLWLNLQAYWKGYNLDKDNSAEALRVLDEMLYDNRKQQICVLDDIRKFQVTRSLTSSTILNSLSFGPTSNDEDDAKAWIGLERNYLEVQKACIQQVGELLHRFEKFEALYPNWKSMVELLEKEDGEDKIDETVQARLKVLYVWYNISNDVCRKINQVGKMLGVENNEAYEWPFIDYSSPKSSRSPSPQANDLDAMTSSGSGLNLSSGSATTPVTPATPGEDNNHLSLGQVRTNALSRSHSDVDMSSCALYKHFVEKSFRFGGMRDVMKRMFWRTGTTLERAMRALQVFRAEKGHATPVRRSILHHTHLIPADYSHLSTPGTHTVTPDNPPKITVTSSDSYSTSSGTGSSNLTQTTSLDTPQTSIIFERKPTDPFERMDQIEYKKRLIVWKQLDKESDPELGKFGVCHDDFERMRLPSFAPSFLFLLRVPLDLVHQWLKLRVKQQLQHNTSMDPIVLKTLISDSHDCLLAAVEVKCYYQEYAQSVTNDEMEIEKLLVDEMSGFEKDLQKMFTLFLDYVNTWATAQYENQSSEWIQTLMTQLEDEWKFAKKIAINVLSGESDAARCFCRLCKQLLEKTSAYMNDGCDRINECLEDEEHTRDDTDSDTDSDDEADDSEQSADEMPYNSPRGHHDDKPSTVLERCRKFKRIICGVRERSLRLSTFCKMLRTDLEITAKYWRTSELQKLLQDLLAESFVLVTTPTDKVDFMMFAEDSIAQNEEHLQLLLNVTCGRDDHEVPQHLAGRAGYLLLVKCNDNYFQSNRKIWKNLGGKDIKVIPDADTEMCLRYMKVDDDAVHLVVVNSAGLAAQRKELAKKQCIHLLEITNEQCSCHDLIADYMNELKDSCLANRQLIAERIEDMTEELLDDNDLDDLDKQEKSTHRACIIQAYNFAFEYQRELARLISSPDRSRALGVGMYNFVRQWTAFVLKFIERGKGCRPRWANDSFNFLLLSVQPAWTKCLSDIDFAELTGSIELCKQHLLGDKSNVEEDKENTSQDKPRSQSVSVLPDSLQPRPIVLHSKSSGTPSPGSYTEQKFPPRLVHLRSNTVEGILGRRHGSSSNELLKTMTDPKQRVHLALREVERRREEKLVGWKSIGRVTEGQQQHTKRLDARKRVPFQWQRLEKDPVGKGRFGVVYIAWNLDNKMLMAMKEMKLDREDHGFIKQLVEEISNVQSLPNHPNLVKYYGVETHKTDVFIFMEYCNEGNLSDACRQSLDPMLIRQYTYRLLKGVVHLHNHQILHRDIKPQNIFLTSKPCQLKLGDFGSSTRLKSEETVAGECIQMEGTVNYMAPEVIDAGSTGYGRAADIWSVGCTVLNMITGKIPHADKSDVNIIYSVGSTKNHPPIPDTVTREARQFLNECFHKEPDKRQEAGKLIVLPYAKVIDENDENTIRF